MTKWTATVSDSQGGNNKPTREMEILMEPLYAFKSQLLLFADPRKRRRAAPPSANPVDASGACPKNASGTRPGIHLCNGYGCDPDYGHPDCQTKARGGYPTTSWRDRRGGDSPAMWQLFADLQARFTVEILARFLARRAGARIQSQFSP